MDPQGHNRNRSVSSVGHQDLSINSEGTTSPLPSSTTFAVASSAATSMSLSVGIDPQSTQVQDQNFFITPPYLDQTSVDPSLQFTQAGKSTTLNTTDYTDSDFSLFPTGVAGSENNFDQPLFDQSLNSDITSPQINTSSPTSAGLLKPEPHASPAMLQNQFSSPPGGHSRNASLGPQDALLISQDWTGMSFQTHRRSPSEFSDRSSVHSPHLTTNDTFDTSLDGSGHSPLQRPIDNPMYQDMNMRIGNFTLSEQPSPNIVPGHSPSHSPAMSPQMMPAPMSADLNPPVGFGMMPTGQFVFGGMTTQETFPTLQSQVMPTMAPPAINIQLAPSSKEFDSGQTLNSSSLTPPERGRTRPRSVTDPYNASLRAGNTLSPNLAASMSRENSRSGSPSSRGSSVSSTRRRQSTSSVPNNVMALRLADPEYQNSSESGNARRVQKHPATFQCTLCPKRFTRAYNLRSHLRTHTDERPFVCTVCGKAFARQHDRKRHESLHSGEKKFVCKGDLKTGGQWGCSRRFARADALGRHFRSEAGRVCIKPLLDEEALERQRTWQEQQMAQNMSQGMTPQMTFGPDGYPMDPSGGYALPQALLAQYPALAQMNWGQPGPAIEEDLSGRSSFEASDYDGEGDDGGYVSGPGTGFGDGSIGQNFDLNYTSDFGQAGR